MGHSLHRGPRRWVVIHYLALGVGGIPMETTLSTIAFLCDSHPATDFYVASCTCFQNHLDHV